MGLWNKALRDVAEVALANEEGIKRYAFIMHQGKSGVPMGHEGGQPPNVPGPHSAQLQFTVHWLLFPMVSLNEKVHV